MKAILSLITGLLLAGAALAQDVAPQGNAHPEANLLTSAGEQIVNPFGEPVDTGLATPSQKRDFAEQVDLDPLRDLAVFHNGRVKILDTLARETVRQITGKRQFPDSVPTDDGFEAYKQDPMFTFMDIVIDPVYYARQPLIHVEYLPLRERMLEIAHPDDSGARERYKKLTRIRPVDAIRALQTLQSEGVIEQSMLKGMRQVSSALELWGSSMQNLMLVAPDSPTDTYHHLGEINATHPARVAAARLGEAWRVRDADAANSAIIALAEALPKINEAQYPTLKRTLELGYNKANAFEWGMWLYFVALLTLVLAFATGRTWLVYLGTGALILAIGFHAAGFGLRCFIAERFAIQNQFESMTGLSLFATVVGGAIMAVKRQWLFGAAAAGVGFLVLITATQTGIPGVDITREAAILNTSVLLKYHVTTVLVSYGLISLGFVISLFYLGTYYAGKMKARAEAKAAADGGAESLAAHALGLEEGVNVGRQRVLADLDRALMTILQLAFWTLAVGIMLGAWWADHSWGRWWAFDPKETWALATWIIYLIVIHVRLVTTKNRQLITAWLSVVGFIVMLWTYFGVNLLLPGLHAYA